MLPALNSAFKYAGHLFDNAVHRIIERLCRYITRPAVSTERLSLTAQGNVRYRLVAPAHPCARDIRASLHIKTPYRDGTTDVVLEPLDFIARLSALVPTPRVNLTRYHGVFAPNHRLREQITPARRGRRKTETIDEPAPARHVAMTPDQVRGRLWAQRLKRVFKIDIETCAHCGGAIKVIASIRLKSTLAGALSSSDSCVGLTPKGMIMKQIGRTIGVDSISRDATGERACSA